MLGLSWPPIQLADSMVKQQRLFFLFINTFNKTVLILKVETEIQPLWDHSYCHGNPTARFIFLFCQGLKTEHKP